jgi:hypothetical protein
MKGKYENTNPLEKLHAGEPYFFLRAQDMHSTYAVRQYAEAVGVLDPKGKAECLAFADRMEKWQDENADKAADCPVCLGALIEEHDKAAHDAAWEKNFVKPIGREMKKRGIAYMVMILREDGKLAYVLDKEIPENT